MDGAVLEPVMGYRSALFLGMIMGWELITCFCSAALCTAVVFIFLSSRFAIPLPGKTKFYISFSQVCEIKSPVRSFRAYALG